MSASPNPSLESVRVDKWLWAARLFKTRSMASRACASGHVKCNGESAKSSRPVRLGDRLEVLTPGGQRIVVVLELHDKRGPAALARSLYEDHSPPPPPRPEDPVAARERGTGRPTKRDRRLQDRWRDPW